MKALLTIHAEFPNGYIKLTNIPYNPKTLKKMCAKFINEQDTSAVNRKYYTYQRNKLR